MPEVLRNHFFLGRHAEVAGVCSMKVDSHILLMSISTVLHFQTYFILRVRQKRHLQAAVHISLPDLGDKPNQPVLSAPDKHHSATPQAIDSENLLLYVLRSS